MHHFQRPGFATLHAFWVTAAPTASRSPCGSGGLTLRQLTVPWVVDALHRRRRRRRYHVPVAARGGARWGASWRAAAAPARPRRRPPAAAPASGAPPGMSDMSTCVVNKAGLGTWVACFKVGL